MAFVANEFGSATPSYAGIRNKHSTAALTIRYYLMSGIESYWSYSQASAGLAGTGYVNLATGALSFAIDTLACTDSLFGYMPTLVYNQSMAGKFYHSGNADVAYYTQKAGYGFILSVNETIIIGPDTDGIATDVDSYIWIDGDGTSHEFLPVVGNGSVTHYVDTDGMQLTLTPTATGFTMEDQSHMKRHFVTSTTSAMVDGSAALSAIEDPVGNRLEFSLDTYSKVYAISLRPVGMSPILLLQLTYNTAGLVTCITRPATQEKVRFYYSTTYQSSVGTTYSGFLRKIERVYGDTTLTSTFTYDASGKLLTAYDQTNAYGIAFTYTGSQVTEMHEYAGSATNLGQTMGFSYHVGGAEVRSSGSDDEYGNGDDIITHYVFDNRGRANSLYSTDVEGTTFYGGTSGTYATQENVKNNLTSTFSFGGTGINYLYNGGFEKTQTALVSPFVGWETSAGWSSLNNEGLGGRSAKAIVTFQTPRTMKQTVYLEAGQYVFSIDLKHYEAKSTQIILSATSTTNSSTSFSKRYSTSDLLEGSDTYTITLSFQAPMDGLYEIGVSVNPDSGLLVNSFVGFDNAMLVRSSAVEDYNMLEFGTFDDFRSSANSTTSPLEKWTTDGAIVSATSVGEDAMFGNILELNDSATSASQIIYRDTSTPTAALLKRSTSYTLSVSGMAKGSETILSGYSKFEIQLKITYCIPKYDDDGNLDGYTVETQTTSLCFLKDCNEWQYAFMSITTLPYLITNMEVVCLYSGHIGAGYFDKVSVTVQKSISGTLTRYNDDGKVEITQEENYLQYYFYDEKGRVKATLDSENCFLLYCYDDNTNQVISVTEREHIDEALYDCIINEEPPSVDSIINNYLNILKYKTEYTYNAYGLLTTCTVSKYNGTTAKEPDNSPRALYNSSQTYAITSGSKIFGATLTSTDTMGAVTRYFYDEARGLLLAVIEPDNTGTVYQYDEVGNMTGVLPATYTASSNSYSPVTGAENVTYTYDSHLWLSEIETASTTYSFSYNIFGQTEGISVGNTEIVSHTYEEQSGKLKSTTYANGTTVEYVYNDRSQLAEVWHQYGAVVPDEPTYTYLYNEDGTLARFDDNRNGEAYIYEYDAAGRMSAYIKCSIDGTVVLFSASCSYNQSGKLSAFKYAGQHGSGTSAIQYSVSNSFTYQSDGRLSTHIIQANSATLQNGYTYEEYSGDTYHSTAVFLGDSEEKAFSIAKAWIYEHSDGTYRTSPTSFELWHNRSKNAVYEFTYDANGNITSIIHKDPNSTSTSPVASYHYDDLGQLVREDNFIFDRTVVYEYDNAGNIKSQKIYAYTDPDDEVGQVLDTISYSYYVTEWGDRLLTYDNGIISYDANGNPLQYYNSFDFTWVNGSELATATKGTNSLSFSYDDNGVRVRKTVNGVDHLYTVNGSQILAEEWGNELLVYLYDANGAPIGMEYRNSTYATGVYDLFVFETNMFGDITGIYDADGNKLISYTYDAWGNCQTTLHTDNLSGSDYYAQKNPFRYRGYYYDTELGLYYLNARYYDPNTGRFISADDVSYLGADGKFTSYNLYTYCGNNPIMYADPSGHVAISTLILCGLALVGMGLTIGGVATDNNIMTAIGLTMVAVPALISGVGAIATGATYLSIIGGITAFAGIGSGFFATTEYIEAFTGKNWIIDLGLSEGWYNGLLLATAAVATLGTLSCGVLSTVGQASAPNQMVNSISKHPNRWKQVDQLIETATGGKYKGGTSYYTNYINRWTGVRAGTHKIVKGGRIIHKLHYHPWFVR